MAIARAPSVVLTADPVDLQLLTEGHDVRVIGLDAKRRWRIQHAPIGALRRYEGSSKRPRNGSDPRGERPPSDLGDSADGL